MLQADGDEAARRAELERALREIEDGIAVGAAHGGVLAIWRLHRGVVLFQLGRLDEADAELSWFVAAEPNNLQGHRMRSLVLTAAKRPLESGEPRTKK